MRSHFPCILRWRRRCCIWRPEDLTGLTRQKDPRHINAAVCIYMPRIFSWIHFAHRSPDCIHEFCSSISRLHSREFFVKDYKKSFLRHPTLPLRRVPPHAPPSHNGHSIRHSHRRTSHKDPDSPSYTRTRRTPRSPHGLPARRPSGIV